MRIGIRPTELEVAIIVPQFGTRRNLDCFAFGIGLASQQNSAQLTMIESSAFIHGENQTWLRLRPMDWTSSRPGSGLIRSIMFYPGAGRSEPDGYCSNFRFTRGGLPA